MSIFDGYSSDVIHDGTLKFHACNDNDLLIILDDYSSEDGHFRDFEYVHVLREKHEEGYIFRCTCKIYRTNLDSVGDNLSEYDSLDVVQGMKCMHCRFLHDHVIPSIHSSNDTNLP